MLSLRINNEILKFKKVINNYYALGKPIDLQKIKDQVNGRKQVKRDESRLTDYIKEHFETSNKYVYGTRKNYTSCRKAIEKYLPAAKLYDIDADWMRGFEGWLRNVKKYSDWTINTRTKIVKTAVFHAFQQRKIGVPNFSGYTCKRGKARRKFLKPQELKKMESYSPEREVDNEVLRAFLFCCYAGGMRFSDACVLQYNNIQKEHNGYEYEYRLNYKMRKTGKHIDLVLNQKSLNQLDLDKCGTDEMVFGILKKEDLEESQDDIRKKIESRNAYVNLRLKKICEDAGLLRKFTFHESRHSFFCNGLQLGIDLMSLKEVGGHSDVKITQEYLQVVDEQKKKAMQKFDML